MKKESIDAVKQAIIDEYDISEELATFAAKVALEGVGKSLIMLADKLVKFKGDNK